ncbi:MAG: hypothetical protein ACRD3N_03860 [Terracidiphilus sp.]
MEPANAIPAPNPHADPPPNPFVGPQPLRTGQPIYARKNEIQQLYYLLLAQRIVLFYSPSGAGKSSLLQAGLIPRLETGFEVWAPVRVNLAPADSGPGAPNRYARSCNLAWESQLLAEQRRPDAELSSMTLAQYVASRQRQKSSRKLVLLFDQFEEILTAGPLEIDAKRAFFEQLGDLLQQPGDSLEQPSDLLEQPGDLLQQPVIWAVIALREDYLAALDPYAELVPTHLLERFRLDLFTRDAAAEAIAKICEQAGRKFTQGALDKLVADLAQARIQQPDGSFLNQPGPYVEPLQLQVAGRRLWQSLPAGQTTVEESDVAKFGDVGAALAEYYADEVARVAGHDHRVERSIRSWFDSQLIAPGKIRGQVVRGEGKTGASPNCLANELVEDLVHTHLVRGEQRLGATWYELAHDRLIDPVLDSNKAWFDEHLRPFQKAAELWQESKQEGLLLLGGQLKTAEEDASGTELLDFELAFLDASRAAQKLLDEKQEALRREREQAKRLRLLLSVATVASVVCIVLLGLAVWAMLKAARQTKRANCNAVAASLSERSEKVAEGNATTAAAAAEAAKKIADDDQVAEKLAEGAAEANAKQAQYNLSLLFADKAAAALASAESDGSAMDYEDAWVYTTGILADLDVPDPEVAGRLLRSEFYPGPRPPEPESRPELKDAAHAAFLPGLKGIVYATETKKDLPNQCTITSTVLHCLALHGAGSCPTLPVQPMEQIGALSIDALSIDRSGDHLLVVPGPSVTDCQGNALYNPYETVAVAFSSGRPATEAIAASDGRIALEAAPAAGQARPSAPRQVIATNGGITALAFWPGNPELLVSGQQDGSVAVWDIRTLKKLAQIRLHQDAVLAVGFSAGGRTMETASKDGTIRSTSLSVPAFGRTWDVRTLLMPEQGRELRGQLHRLSIENLGFDPKKKEPTPLENARMMALRYFARPQDIHFTEEENSRHELLVRSRNPERLEYPYPAVTGNEIELMPDQVGSYNSVAIGKQPLRSAFKVEFDYRMDNRVDQNPYLIGDGLSFMFYTDKDLIEPDNLANFGLSPAHGYAVVFNAYQPTGYGIALITDGDSKHPAKTAPNPVYFGGKWAKVCIEVNPASTREMCAPAGTAAGPFEGVNVYLNGKKVLAYAGKIDAQYGGFGFGASAGEAMAEKTVRDIRITPAGAARPDPKLAAFGSFGAFSSKADYPKLTEDGLELTADTGSEAAAVLLDKSVKVPSNFYVDFDYAMVNHCFMDRKCTTYRTKIPGNGLAFLFGANREAYRTEALPMGEGHGYLHGSGYGVVFNTYNGQRSIELVNQDGKAIATGSALSLPDIYPGLDARGNKQWRTVRVEVNSTQGYVRVYYEGVQVLSHSVDLKNGQDGIGFSAATKKLYGGIGQEEHWVRGVVIRPLNSQAQADALQ